MRRNEPLLLALQQEADQLRRADGERIRRPLSDSLHQVHRDHLGAFFRTRHLDFHLRQLSKKANIIFKLVEYNNNNMSVLYERAFVRTI